ncbi:MAG: SAM-dependent methyltransferase [Candidatus Marsarchaeota archaeon]|nr:SAM-dependent methyltransferase [Candidatus Marsarchaeota archaeon]
MRYLLFVDNRFRKEGLEELDKYGKDAAISLEKGGKYDLGNSIIMLSSSKSLKLKGKTIQPTFISNILPVSSILKFKHGDYDEIVRCLKKKLKKNISFKIEALNVNSVSKENAKSIEVKIGQELEKLGFTADLGNPSIMVYIVLAADNAFVCIAKKGALIKDSLDEFRKRHRKALINRAEFKIEEAFDAFDIDKKRLKLVLDIGAAPGGWTNYVSRLGAKVLAVDPAPLYYEKLNMKNVVHINKGAQDIELGAFRNIRFDALLIDANIYPSKSAELANKFADKLNKGAYLVLTVKIVDRKAAKHIREAKELLSEKYGSIKLKKLPHNRMELTLFAIRR